MRAETVQNFERGESPTDALKIGNGRSIEDLVNAKIKETKEDDGLSYSIDFDAIREHYAQMIHYDYDNMDIMDMLDEILKHTPKEYQVDYWLGRHPGTDKS